MSNDLDDIKSALRNFELNGSDAVAQIEGIYKDLELATAQLAVKDKVIEELKERVRTLEGEE